MIAYRLRAHRNSRECRARIKLSLRITNDKLWASDHQEARSLLFMACDIIDKNRTVSYLSCLGDSFINLNRNVSALYQNRRYLLKSYNATFWSYQFGREWLTFHMSVTQFTLSLVCDNPPISCYDGFYLTPAILCIRKVVYNENQRNDLFDISALIIYNTDDIIIY